MLRKPYRFAVLFGMLLLLSTAYVLLDAFLIPRAYLVVEAAQKESTAVPAAEESAAITPVWTENTYTDSHITVTLTSTRVENTTVYVADVVVSDAAYLQTAFANQTYGKNITQSTSAMAQANDAVLAINGDYYGTRSGYVIRNGVLYRSQMASASQEDLAIMQDGTFQIVKEGDTPAQALLDAGAVQVLSFGPGLVSGGAVSVSAGEEVDQARTSNPRTAIGMISPLHYVFVVSDGRTSQSTGLTLYQLASFMQELGVTEGYNLDGSGSSTMVFHGQVVNQPTTNGRTITERSVSDIVYIGD